MERHLKPLAVAANITQAAHCRLDTVLLTFGFLVVQYRAMVKAEDLVGCAAILQSLEKRWLAADQDVFIATVIINPLFQTTPFASGPRFIIARIKALLASLYMRFFQSEVPASFYTEVHEFLMGIKQYSELRATCVRHIHTSKHEVCLTFISSKSADTDSAIGQGPRSIGSFTRIRGPRSPTHTLLSPCQPTPLNLCKLCNLRTIIQRVWDDAY